MIKKYALICSVVLTVFLCTSCVNLKTINKNFEKIEGVKIIKTWYDDGDLDSAGSLISVNDNKLIMFQGLTKKSFIKDKGRVQVSRIGNLETMWKVVVYSYGYQGGYITSTGQPVKSMSFYPSMNFGKDGILNQIFDLNISKVGDVISNYDILLGIIENLPDDEKTVTLFKSEEEELLDFLKEHFFYYYDVKNDMEYWIGRRREGRLNLEKVAADERGVIDQIWVFLEEK
jgi:hypothetical protein